MTKRSRRILILAALFIICGGILQTPLLRNLRNWAWNGWVYSVGWTAKISWKQPDQNRLEELLAENIRLKSELKDYARLRQNLGSLAFDDFMPVDAVIVGRPVDTFQSQFVINKGAAEGVLLGAPIVINGSTLLGFISELHEHSVIGRLLVHPSTTMAADVIDPAISVDEISVSGLIQGRMYTSLFLTTIPRDKSLHEGSRVVTSSQPGEFPAGLFIGTVKTIHDQKDAAYKEAVLELPYALDDIRAVRVLVLP